MPLPSTPQSRSYIHSPEVQAFLDWLAPRWHVPDRLTHCVVDRRSGKERHFSSLLDACQKYEWKGRDLSQTREILGPLSQRLRRAVAQGNESATAEACKAVLSWGGVSPGNDTWVQDHRLDLATDLQRDRDRLLEARDLDQLARFNSGFSKIYSMLMDGLIIYDSRVGAALGDLVIRYAECKGLTQVPSALRFPWDSPKEERSARNPKNRDPSRGGLRLTRIHRDESRARWALRASWLLEALQVHPESTDSTLTALPKGSLDDRTRTLEAGLFMWGYDLPRGAPSQHSATPTTRPKAQRQSGLSPIEESPSPTTRGGPAKGRAFRWEYIPEKGANGSLVVRVGSEPLHIYPLEEVLRILEALYLRFGQDYFPLANNVATMPKGTERDGLGMTIFVQPGSSTTHAQGASYLGVVFESLGLTEWNGQFRGIAWRLLREPPHTVASLRALVRAGVSP
jgi:hypothetical protein